MFIRGHNIKINYTIADGHTNKIRIILPKYPYECEVCGFRQIELLDWILDDSCIGYNP